MRKLLLLVALLGLVFGLAACHNQPPVGQVCRLQFYTGAQDGCKDIVNNNNWVSGGDVMSLVDEGWVVESAQWASGEICPITLPFDPIRATRGCTPYLAGHSSAGFAWVADLLNDPNNYGAVVMGNPYTVYGLYCSYTYSGGEAYPYWIPRGDVQLQTSAGCDQHYTIVVLAFGAP